MIKDLVTPYQTRVVPSYGLLVVFLSLLTIFPPVFAMQQYESEQVTAWQYRWGDSEFVNGEPEWIVTPELHSSDWKDIDFPRMPPDRGQYNTVWFKATLPDSDHDYLHPVLYVTSIDLMAEVYLEDNKIYQFGDLNNKQHKSFYGWPWHSINLPDDYAGKTIYFRVFSSYRDIGLWGEVKLFEKTHLLFYLLEKAYFEVLVALFSLFVAIITLAFSMMHRGERHFLYLSLFSLTSAVMLLAENPAVQFVFNYPLVRVYLLAISYYALPVITSLLLSSWFDDWRHKWLINIAVIHFIYLISVIGLSLAGLIELAVTFPIFDAIFAITILLIIGLGISKRYSLASDQHLVMLSFTVYGMFLLLDMGIANSVLPWMHLDISVGALLFALVLMLISLRHYSHVQSALKELNEHLEVKVAERTASLHAYAEAEQERAEQLQRLNVLGARLEELNSRLQTVDTLTEARHLLIKKLPDVFMPVELSVTTSLDGVSFERQLAQVELQELDGSYNVFVYLVLNNLSSKKLIKQDNLNDFINRVKLRLGVTLSSIKLKEELHRFSFEDALTGLANRRFFDLALHRETQLANRQKNPLSLLICDIDHFKHFNDEYGHEVGDFVLKTLAQLMNEFFRETDIPCRYGGEEFVVIMPGATIDDAIEKAELLKRIVADKQIVFNDKHLDSITISIGIADLNPSRRESEQLLSDADKALYKAKERGRNRVETTHS